MSEQENIQLVRNAYDSFKRGDIAAVISSLADDIKWVTPGPPEVFPMAGTWNGHDGVMQFFSKLDGAEEIQMFEPGDFLADGERVVAFVKFGGKVKSTGISFTSDLVHIFTIRNGKVNEFQEYYDTAAALTAYAANPSVLAHNSVATTLS